jgi:hypothetical protein
MLPKTSDYECDSDGDDKICCNFIRYTIACAKTIPRKSRFNIESSKH